MRPGFIEREGGAYRKETSPLPLLHLQERRGRKERKKRLGSLIDIYLGSLAEKGKKKERSDRIRYYSVYYNSFQSKEKETSRKKRKKGGPLPFKKNQVEQRLQFSRAIGRKMGKKKKRKKGEDV